MRRVTVTNNGDRRARSSSPATARSCSPRPTPSGRIRRSPTCSSRPSGTSGVPPSPPPAAPVRHRAAALVRARRGRRRRACRGRSPARPTARASSAAVAARATPSRWSGTARSRGRPAPCSIRSSRSARGSRSRPGSPPRWRSPRSSPPAASARSSWPTATTTRTPRSARSISPGPPARSSCASCTSRRPTRRSSRSWPATSSTATRRSGRPRRSCGAIAGSQPLLWSNGVSGDWPILLATIDSADGLPTLRQLLAAHRYWRRRGMTVDLVVLNAHPPDYQQDLRGPDHRRGVRGRGVGQLRPGRRRLLRRRDLLGREELLMLRATARVHIACDGRPLGQDPVDGTARGDPRRRARHARARAPRPRAQRLPGGPRGQADRREDPRSPRPAGVRPAGLRQRSRVGRWRPPIPRTAHDNGLGGLVEDGDYEIDVRGDHVPPAPWSNVIANPHGGFVVTERGGGFTWAENSYFYRLTPWHNDPVSDPVSEAIYLQDAETGELWSATPAPVRSDDALHRAPRRRARPSSSTVATASASHLTLGMADDAPVKLSLLRLTNTGARPRRLLGHDVRGVDARRPARAHPAPGRHVLRAGARRDLRPQHLRPGVRRLGRVPRDERAGLRATPATGASSSAATGRHPAPRRSGPAGDSAA